MKLSNLFFIALLLLSNGAFSQSYRNTKIYGGDELYSVDVNLINGVKRMATDSIVTVEQVFGADPIADTWFYIGTQYDATGVGSAGDTVTVNISAGELPVFCPAVSVLTTVTVGIVADPEQEKELSDAIILNLNSDTNFKLCWRATRIKDFSAIHITSKFLNEFGERVDSGDFQTITTGTTITTDAFDSITRRGKPTELARSPNDPRQGILSISGSISISPEGVANRFETDALDVSLSNDLTVDGDPTPVDFSIKCDPSFDLFVTSLKMHGVSNGVKFGKFLSLNSKLINGLTFFIKSDDLPAEIDTIYSTDDMKARFSTITGFDLHIQAGGDHVLATHDFGLTPIVIRQCGTFPVDDIITITVNDDIDQVSELFLTACGFRRGQ